MDVVGGLFLLLLGSGHYLNTQKNKDKNIENFENKKSKNKEISLDKKRKIMEKNQRYNIDPRDPIDHVPKNLSESIKASTGEPCVSLPQESGTFVTPFYYNTLQLTGSVKKIPNSKYNPKAIFAGLDPKTCERIRVQSLNEFEQYFAKDAGPNSTKGDDWDHIGRGSQYQTLQADENYLDETKMVHTNMVPFYKGNITQNVDPENRMAAQKLELFTGNFKLRKHNKTEVEPFFAPTANLGNIYGNVEKRELDRYKPSNTGKKNNELPFNQVRVGPGLNKGFTAAPSGGFHETLRVLPKVGSDLYVNPKSESEGRVNHGKAPTENRTLNPVQYKYKPTLLVENKCGERNFTTVGAVKGRKLRPGIVLKDTNRRRSMKVMGPAGPGETNYNRPENLYAKVQKSHKTNYKNTPYRNAVLAEGKKVNDYGKAGYENRPNERTVTGTRTYWSNLKYAVNKIMAPFTDQAKYTRKQEYIRNPRQSGNVRVQKPSNLPAYDPKDVAKTTIRETTENNGRKGPVSKIGAGKSIAYDPKDVAKTTIRETTENNLRKGPVSKIGAGKSIAYDPCDLAKTTIRETTENNLRKGPVSKLGAGKSLAYDPSDVAKTTIRETTENNLRKGPVSKLGAGKSLAYDPTDVAKTTIRETTENNRRKGMVSKLGAGKSLAYDPTDVTKTTIRETTENNLRKGQISKIGAGKSLAYDPTDVAKTTIRETTENNQRKGMVSKIGAGKSLAYDPTDVAKTTIRETTENNRRRGQVSKIGAGKSRAYDPMDVAKTTIRETTENNRRQGQVSKIGAGKSRAYDPTDVAKTTIRETTENNLRKGPVSKIGAGKSRAYDPKDVARTTIRETTENNLRKGPVSKIGAGKSRAYDPKDVAKTTIRETTENNRRKGMVSKIGAGKSRAYDPRDVAKTTIRETTENNRRKGPVSKIGAGKSRAYDPKDVAKTTIRETTENNKHKGIVSKIGAGKSKVYDPTDVAKTTIKETTENMKRLGNVGGRQFQNGDGYKVTNVYANNTNRQFTSDYAYTPAADAAGRKKAISYDSAYNADLNLNKELIAEGRQPTKQSVKLNKGVTDTQWLNYEVKKVEGDSINWRGNVKDTNVGNVFNPNAISMCTTTSFKNNLPSDFTRLDTTILDAYKRNPLTQSLQSYA